METLSSDDFSFPIILSIDLYTSSISIHDDFPSRQLVIVMRSNMSVDTTVVANIRPQISRTNFKWLGNSSVFMTSSVKIQYMMSPMPVKFVIKMIICHLSSFFSLSSFGSLTYSALRKTYSQGKRHRKKTPSKRVTSPTYWIINVAAAKLTIERNGAVVTRIQLEREEWGNKPRILRDPASSAEGNEMRTGRIETKFLIPKRMIESCDPSTARSTFSVEEPLSLARYCNGMIAGIKGSMKEIMNPILIIFDDSLHFSQTRSFPVGTPIAPRTAMARMKLAMFGRL
mmetsp:Transcript_43527/g.74284  ORF Transcript_43527/g.74284 Transcript_43527/m.74284 type:complete len:285 (+) Transcript_43527:1464-2318(+)